MYDKLSKCETKKRIIKIQNETEKMSQKLSENKKSN